MLMHEQLPDSRAISTISQSLEWFIVGVIHRPIQSGRNEVSYSKGIPLKTRFPELCLRHRGFYLPSIFLPRFKGCSEIIVENGHFKKKKPNPTI